MLCNGATVSSSVPRQHHSTSASSSCSSRKRKCYCKYVCTLVPTTDAVKEIELAFVTVAAVAAVVDDDVVVVDAIDSVAG